MNPNPDFYHGEMAFTLNGESFLITSMPDVPGFYLYDETGCCIEEEPFETIKEAFDWAFCNLP